MKVKTFFVKMMDLGTLFFDSIFFRAYSNTLFTNKLPLLTTLNTKNGILNVANYQFKVPIFLNNHPRHRLTMIDKNGLNARSDFYIKKQHHLIVHTISCRRKI